MQDTGQLSTTERDLLDTCAYLAEASESNGTMCQFDQALLAKQTPDPCLR